MIFNDGFRYTFTSCYRTVEWTLPKVRTSPKAKCQANSPEGPPLIFKHNGKSQSPALHICRVHPLYTEVFFFVLLAEFPTENPRYRKLNQLSNRPLQTT
ncbi:hypothetical protein CDAR_251001 [Caerostris darwini]|uniref:Uncharacterized protein n=1 Tax=Caerostris darwini TaxID=1538125 RepID=A0AAV4TMM4_9ARAC|nr:hypothetical protein CDAR_251001 [Caerostris darwini]